jgi:aminoglycoside phosphotransferase family enzyme/predicted kinase
MATRNSPTTQAVVELLQDPASYDEQPKRVELVETHISFVFLTALFAFKLKKPVKFDFLDFSTPDKRREACEDEVRLNRRLARLVYLGVLPVTQSNGRLEIDGDGAPIDWVVKMSRLPADRSLDRLIASAQINDADIQRVGQFLCGFFTSLPPIMVRPDDYRRRLDEHISQNRAALLARQRDFDATAIRRIHEAQLLLLRLNPKLFDHRVLDGRIVEGHGDLRPEHVYLVPKPTIIDCVEFNVELRQLDVLDELCFLAMECERLNAQWISDQIIATYRSASGDNFPDQIAAFYKSYRACVRAKVCALRAAQVAGEGPPFLTKIATDYVAIADRYRAQLGPPVLLVVRGLSGTGKTTLARHLSERLGIERLETDAVRREMFGQSLSPAGYGRATYTPENRERVYAEMLLRAKHLIDSGRSAIVDGTFLTAKSRMDAVALAAGGRAIPLVLECHCPDEVARQRIAARITTENSMSEARPDIYTSQTEAQEPDPPGLPVCHVETTLSLPAMADVVLARLSADWTRTRGQNIAD